MASSHLSPPTLSRPFALATLLVIGLTSSCGESTEIENALPVQASPAKRAQETPASPATMEPAVATTAEATPSADLEAAVTAARDSAVEEVAVREARAEKAAKETEAREASAAVEPAVQPTAPVDRPEGLWNKLRLADPIPGSPEDRGLAGLGYAGAYEEASDLSGAFAPHPDRVQPGLTLFCSGHAPTVVLMDAEGETVHQWTIDFDKAWPESLPFSVSDAHREFIRRAALYPNGDLLAIFEYVGIVKLDKDSQVLWAKSLRTHHDVEILPDGRILTLGLNFADSEEARILAPGLNMPKGLFDNSVLVLSAEGEKLRETSLTRAIHNSPFGIYLSQLPWSEPDLLHANSVQWITNELAEAHEFLEPGNVLVSLRNPGALVVLDLVTAKITWLEVGQWSMQHQAIALENGNLLMMDNRGGNSTRPLWRNRSRALEYHPPTKSVVWQSPRAEEGRLYTDFLGYVQRLSNGNTLITESTQGHVVEVDPAGEVVWEYYSPYRAGPDRTLIATIMGAKRIDPKTLSFLPK